MRFRLTLAQKNKDGYPPPSTITTTGLEQGTVTQVDADDTALFRYRFADMAVTDGGATMPVPADALSIMLRVARDGTPGPEMDRGTAASARGTTPSWPRSRPSTTPQGSRRWLGTDRLVPYPERVGTIHPLSAVKVRLRTLLGTIGTFTENDTATYTDTETDQVISGTEAVGATVEQDSPTRSGPTLPRETVRAAELHAEYGDRRRETSHREKVARDAGPPSRCNRRCDGPIHCLTRLRPHKQLG